MKRLAIIITSVLLAITTLVNDMGLTIVRCSHSGRIGVLMPSALDSDDQCCQPTSGCMTVSYVQQSPASSVQPDTFDFHVIQPVLAQLPRLLALCPQPHFPAALRLAVAQSINAPPRAYLRLMNRLLI